MYYCSGAEVEVRTKTECFDYGGSWINSDYNFDNILSAMATLYVLASTEGWIGLMFKGVDSVGIDMQP